MKNDPFYNIQKRAQRYWYQDGIWEIGFGLICALLGALYLAGSMFPRGGPFSAVLVLLEMGVIFGSFWALNKFARFMKERITYPRTGYVAYRKPAAQPRSKRFLLGTFIVLGMLTLVGILAIIQFPSNRLPLIVAGVFAATLIIVGYRFDLLCMYAIGVLALAWGFSMGLFPLTADGSMGLFMLGFGILLALSGGLALLIYLRSTKPVGDIDYEAPAQENLTDYRQESR